MKNDYKTDEGVRIFADAVNTLSSHDEDAKKAAAGFVSQHRTLQQSMVAFIADTIKEIDKMVQKNPECYTDLRNAEALNWIHKVAEIEAYFPTI